MPKQSNSYLLRDYSNDQSWKEIKEIMEKQIEKYKESLVTTAPDMIPRRQGAITALRDFIRIIEPDKH
jgi:hypothetical protein